jgi:predicted RNA binding protein YcfA (HicA-like mRNA interferase family)
MRQSGSREIWQSPDGTRVVTVAGKDSETVPVGRAGRGLLR